MVPRVSRYALDPGLFYRTPSAFIVILHVAGERLLVDFLREPSERVRLSIVLPWRSLAEPG